MDGASSIGTSPNGWSFVSAWLRRQRRLAGCDWCERAIAFTGYHSTDGKSWSVVGSETIDMSSSVYVGLAVSSRVETVTTAATFTNVAVSNAASGAERASDRVDHQPGSRCDIHRAGKHDRQSPPPAIPMARSPVWTSIKGRRFSSLTRRFRTRWPGTALAAGTYQLTAVARDNDGATRTSAAVTVTVKSAVESGTLGLDFISRLRRVVYRPGEHRHPGHEQ